MTVPTREQVAYATEVLDRRRARALSLLVTAEHRDKVVELVFSFTSCAEDEEITAGRVADWILEYIAEVIVAPLLPREVEG